MSKKLRRSFDSLKTLAGKRVRIAKDALVQLEDKKIVSTPGCYFDTIPAEGDISSDNIEFVRDYDSIKKILADNNTKCTVCALGSLFVGLGSANGDFKGTFGVHSKLAEYFDEHHMDKIEAAYEGTWINGAWENDNERKVVKEFYRSYNNPTDRLKGILENIIKNRGTFKPETSL